MVVCFRPGKLGEKPDSLTRRVFTLANPQNLRPVFTQEKLAAALRATCLQPVASLAASLIKDSIPILDSAALLEDIKIGLQEDLVAARELSLCLQQTPSPCFSVSQSSLLLLDTCVYILNYRPE